MRLSAFFRPELLAFSLLGLMILSAANAQTRELGAFALGAGTLNPGTPDTGSNAAPPSPETNEKVESEPEPSLSPVLVRRPQARTMKKPLSQARSLNRILSPANRNPQPCNRNPKLRAPTRNQPKTVLRF